MGDRLAGTHTAFQLAMRILKRPAAPVPPVGPGETLKDREARYQKASVRIFGKEAERSGAKEVERSGEGDKDRDKEMEKKSGAARDPRGPQPTTAAGQKGFKARSGRPPPPTTPNPHPTLAHDPPPRRRGLTGAYADRRRFIHTPCVPGALVILYIVSLLIIHSVPCVPDNTHARAWLIIWAGSPHMRWNVPRTPHSLSSPVRTKLPNPAPIYFNSALSGAGSCPSSNRHLPAVQNLGARALATRSVHQVHAIHIKANYQLASSLGSNGYAPNRMYTAHRPLICDLRTGTRNLMDGFARPVGTTVGVPARWASIHLRLRYLEARAGNIHTLMTFPAATAGTPYIELQNSRRAD
ncbi:hypothetical protein FB451DRAFT_1412708 [Mycena latifolia]|nr:hypothetical protein FB451DRAFT_1412708 [Mycena latifolia]